MNTPLSWENYFLSDYIFVNGCFPGTHVWHWWLSIFPMLRPFNTVSHAVMTRTIFFCYYFTTQVLLIMNHNVNLCFLMVLSQLPKGSWATGWELLLCKCAEARREGWIPWNWLWGCWQSNLGPLKEWLVLLKTEMLGTKLLPKSSKCSDLLSPSFQPCLDEIFFKMSDPVGSTMLLWLAWNILCGPGWTHSEICLLPLSQY